MDLDASLIEYMRKRAELAKLVACAITVQCFVLAVFFCAYGLCYSQFAYSKSIEAFRLGIIIASIIITIGLVIFNRFVCIRYKLVEAVRPDYIALRQSGDVVWEAYMIARPILIFKITLAGFFMTASGLMYIVLVILMDRAEMATVYGRIIVFLCIAAATMIGYPSIDRLYSYRCALREIHVAEGDMVRKSHLGYGFAILTPISICCWYIIRFYTAKFEIAWIVFPMMALFGLAIVYLSNWLLDDKGEEEEDLKA